MKKQTNLLISAFLLLLFTFTNAATAIEFSGTGGKPAFPREENPRTDSIFVHIMKPGETVEEGIRAINNSDVIQTLLVYATDTSPASAGGFACKQLAEPKENVGTWINLKQTEITLEPKTNRVIPFTITVPENYDVGEHDACIAIQTKAAPSKGEEGGMSIGTRSAIRVAITVPGEIIRNIEITDFSAEKGSVSAIAKNNGNVSIDANIEIILKNMFGQHVITYGGEFPVLRDKPKEWHFALPDFFWGGWYSADLTITYDEDPEAQTGVNTEGKLTSLEKDTIWLFIPPSTTGLIVEIIIVLFILINLFVLIVAIKRKRWIKHKWIEYKVNRNDNLQILGEKFDVSYNLLIKANKLKFPFILKQGQIIKVPPSKKTD